ncbi:MAG: hypothetical protein U0136_19470 [Bdellovibrionota bacterium]
MNLAFPTFRIDNGWLCVPDYGEVRLRTLASPYGAAIRSELRKKLSLRITCFRQNEVQQVGLLTLVQQGPPASRFPLAYCCLRESRRNTWRTEHLMVTNLLSRGLVLNGILRLSWDELSTAAGSRKKSRSVMQTFGFLSLSQVGQHPLTLEAPLSHALAEQGSIIYASSNKSGWEVVLR